MGTGSISTSVESRRVEHRTPSRRVAGFLVLAGLWPLLVWPNFVRVVATDERAWDDGPTAYLLVHVSLATASMAIGVVLVVLGVRAWRRR